MAQSAKVGEHDAASDLKQPLKLQSCTSACVGLTSKLFDSDCVAHKLQDSGWDCLIYAECLNCPHKFPVEVRRPIDLDFLLGSIGIGGLRYCRFGEAIFFGVRTGSWLGLGTCVAITLAAHPCSRPRALLRPALTLSDVDPADDTLPGRFPSEA
eukprot:scaffold4806_cov363-Prasinococcus_capsulatus_cf.AAC.3